MYMYKYRNLILIIFEYIILFEMQFSSRTILERVMENDILTYGEKGALGKKG